MAKQQQAQNYFKEADQKRKQKEKKRNFSLKPDQRYAKVLGVVLLAFGALLFLAFTSFLFSWQVDQSLLSQLTWQKFLQANPQMAENWVGIIGAYLGHLFIYRWFGVAAYLLIFLLGLIGVSLMLQYEPLPIRRNLTGSVFFIAWSSVLLGLAFQQTLPLLGGGFGYTAQLWLRGVLGTSGLVLLLLVSLLVYLIIAFDLKISLQPFFTAKNGLTSATSRLQSWFSYVWGQQTATASPAPEPQTPSPEGTAQATEAAHDSPAEPHTSQATNQPPATGPTALELDPSPGSTTEAPAAPDNPPEPQQAAEAEDSGEPSLEIEDTRTKEEPAAEDREMLHTAYDPTLDLSQYRFPPVDLLNEYNTEKRQVNQEELEERKNLIINTLKNYKIEIDKIKATVGPTVTLYEIVPAPGVRISKIRNLEDDIALSLAALGIRIIAPIPGRGTIGIEVPNSKPEMVAMKHVLSSREFKESTYELPIALGKTISNEVYLTDLTKMPHLLMAGATGQGKSVGLNVMLGSLLYKKHPSQVKFVLVDPKKVELSLFQKIKNHFLAQLPGAEEPIITDTNQVITSLNSLCTEMDQRYDLLKDAQVRNLAEYNKKFINRQLNPQNGHRFLPYIVLVIDEMADLMMTAGKEVEAPIARLAQLARAIGIHLILATQRPSVNIITGVIKANFPARIAFRVTSRVDSRTILDAGGAEQLIGKGDMLFTDGGDLERLQCAFLDTEEVEEVTDFISQQQSYTQPYELPEAAESGGGGQATADDVLDNLDPLFNEAAQLIVKHQQGSTSLIQRRLKLGYNRAGRIVDQLEAAGVIGPYEGSKSRDVLIDDEYALEQFLSQMGEDS